MERAGPRRRPEAGGYARGDEKRVRIVEAALRRFGTDGYEGASTREIAREAGVNPPALQYYFGGKAGLYFACQAHFVARFRDGMQASYGRAALVGEDGAAAVEVLCDLMDAIADFLFETAARQGWSGFIARLQSNMDSGPLDPALRETISDELSGHCRRLVGLALGRPDTEDEVRLRAIAITGQLHPFHDDPAEVLRALGWTDLRGERLALLKSVIRRQTRAALGYQESRSPPAGVHTRKSR